MALINLETSRAVMVVLLGLCSVRRGKLWRGWSLSSNVDIEAKFEAKWFALSVEEDMTSGPIIIMDTVAFTFVHDLVGDLPEFTASIFFLF